MLIKCILILLDDISSAIKELMERHISFKDGLDLIRRQLIKKRLSSPSKTDTTSPPEIKLTTKGAIQRFRNVPDALRTSKGEFKELDIYFKRNYYKYTSNKQILVCNLIKTINILKTKRRRRSIKFSTIPSFKYTVWSKMQTRTKQWRMP